MRSRNKFQCLVLLAIVILAVVACNRSETSLDKTTRQLIETMARTEIAKSDSLYNAQCDSIYALWLEQAKDSIYQTRSSEIQFIKSNQ